MYEPIAIIGISGKFPMSENLEDFHGNLLKGKDCISGVPNERKVLLSGKDLYDIECGYLTGIADFDPAFFNISAKEAAMMSPEQRISLELAAEAIWNSGYSVKSFEGAACGVFVASSHNQYESIAKECSGLLYIGSLKAMLSGKIAYYFDLHGPNIMYDTGCSSSLVCIHEACQKLAAGDIDYALAGGISIGLFPQKDYLGINSHDGRCRSFDDEATGTSIGEGGGFILLKRLKNAEEDKDNILAVIRASALNSDGKRCSTITSPGVEGQKEVMLKAWEKGNIDANAFTNFEAHGTGTKIGDPIEVTSITESLIEAGRSEKEKIVLGSVKSAIGHMGYAAGIGSVIKVVLEYINHVSYPIVHYKNPNKIIDIEHTPLLLQNIPMYYETDKERQTGINSFSLNGTNAHIVLTNYLKKQMDEKEQQNYMLKISGKTEQSFNTYASKILHFLEKKPDNWKECIYTLNVGRDDYPFRQIVRGNTLDELLSSLRELHISSESRNKKLICAVRLNDLPVSELKVAWEQLVELESLYHGEKIVLADETGKRLLDSIGKGLLFEEYKNEKLENCHEEQSLKRYLKVLEQLDKTSEEYILIECGKKLNNIRENFSSIFFLNPLEQEKTLIELLYLAGLEVDWNSCYRNFQYQRTIVPLMCFDNKIYWIGQNEKRDEKETDSKYSLKDQIMHIWQEVLEYTEPIDYDESFFDLGGNSLLISMMTERISENMGVEIEIEDVYDYDTINLISDLILKLTEEN